MTHKTYTHHCKKNQGREVTLGTEICPDCGEIGEFAGWGKSVIEHMSSYQRRYNLRALGPHRRMTDKLFSDRMIECDRCNGVGVIGVNDNEYDVDCPKCEFKGYLFDGTPEEFESIRKEIITVYPTAEPGTPLSEPPQTIPPEGFVGGGFSKPADLSKESIREWAKGFLKSLNPDYEQDSSDLAEKEKDDE